jgi:hypothetical protein
VSDHPYQAAIDALRAEAERLNEIPANNMAHYAALARRSEHLTIAADWLAAQRAGSVARGLAIIERETADWPEWKRKAAAEDFPVGAELKKEEP